MARVRGIIIDNSGASSVTGKSSIFLNTTSTANTLLTDTLGVKSINQISQTIKDPGATVQTLTGTNAWTTPSAINIVEVIAELRPGTKKQSAAPVGGSLMLRLRYLNSSNVITYLPLTIAANTTRASVITNINLFADTKIYADVIKVAKQPGLGLIYYIKYYS